MSEVPPNRRRVADQESGDAGGESSDREFPAHKEQNPKRDNDDKKQLHAPERHAASESEETKIARAWRKFAFDPQKQNDECRYEQKIKCVATRLEMPL